MGGRRNHLQPKIYRTLQGGLGLGEFNLWTRNQLETMLGVRRLTSGAGNRGGALNPPEHVFSIGGNKPARAVKRNRGQKQELPSRGGALVGQ